MPDGRAQRLSDSVSGCNGSNAHSVGAVDGRALLSAGEGVRGIEPWTPKGLPR
jgi:hypothetical protein